MHRSFHTCLSGSSSVADWRMVSSWQVGFSSITINSNSPHCHPPLGDNTGGVLFPIILPALISRFGIKTTTRIYSIALAICLFPVLPFMKARLPESRVHGPAPRSSGTRTWMTDRTFWFFIAINTLQGFAHFVPLTWLPSTSHLCPSSS